MGIVELVKKGFGVTMKCKPLILVLFAFGFAWNLINIPLGNQVQEANVGASFTVIILSIAFILLSIFMQAGTLGYVRDVVKGGTSNLAAFKESGLKYYLRVLAIGFIVGLAVVIIFTLAALVLVVLGAAPDFLRGIVGTIFVVGGVVAVIFLFLAPYAAVADDTGIFDSLKASIAVVKAYFWKLFLTGLLLMAVLFLLGFVVGLIIGLMAGLMAGAAGQIITGFLSSILNAYFGVVVTGTFMSFYLAAKSGSSGGPTPGTS